jgi:Cdc6-like AAA superfamily ATPase
MTPEDDLLQDGEYTITANIEDEDEDLLHEMRDLGLAAASAFQPRTPITTKALFAGRWNQMTTLADAVSQPGLHVVIYGERGVGKTSLANVVKPLISVLLDGQQQADQQPSQDRLVVKANANSGDTFSTIWEKLLGDFTWQDATPVVGLLPNKPGMVSVYDAFGLNPPLTVDQVRRVISRIPRALFIIDEFDRAAQTAGAEFTDLMKALSDFGSDCTVILVGVSDTVDRLVADHASINRALVQILLPRMEVGELREILTKAEDALAVKFTFEASNLIVNISQGLPHYTHLLGLHAVRSAANRVSRTVIQDDVFSALKEAVKQAQQTVTEKYLKATHSAHKEALYRHVLLACALTAARSHDPLGYFNPAAIAEPLSVILDRRAEIATFSNHLSEFCQEKRGEVLERAGQARAYRFRFRDPLLVPFVFMEAVATGLIDNQQLAEMLGGAF